jgi:hypothetical protein
MIRHLFVLPLLGLVGALGAAQSNVDLGIDVRLAEIDDLRALGRAGTFPNGVNGCAFETTACNVGTKEVLWQQAMDPDHPFICFLLARESNGRFEQISDRSYVKHGFFALSSTFCSSCSPTDGTRLGLGCSDTYSVGNNGDNFWLGPPSEIDPWNGIWDPVCSHFDRGEPAVAPPLDCNGARSLTSGQAAALGAVGHRIRVLDADFNVSGAAFWFQGMYVIETEGDRVRDDNIASRAFTPIWTGASWNLAESGAQTFGSVLTRWSGASVKSNTNGTADGRLYVAVKTSGPDPSTGLYHYEYAVHNRDNARGVSALRIPVCSGARVLNLGFGDIDQDAGNDWTASVVGDEIVFTGAANPLEWNSLYNFWFDSDAAPVDDAVQLDPARPGPGGTFVAVISSAPLALPNVFLGAGCDFDAPPSLFANGAATLGNAGFALRSLGNTPGQPSFLRYSVASGSHVLGGCTRYLGPTPGLSFSGGSAPADGTGLVVFPAGVPNDVGLEGLSLQLQITSRDPGNGPVRGNFDLSDGLRVRIGNAIPGCP